MKKWFIKYMAAAAVCFLGACVPVTEMPAEIIEREADTPEHRVCRALLLSFMKNDAVAFTKQIPQNVTETFKVEDFIRMRETAVKTYGNPVSFSFITQVQYEEIRPLIWKIRFCKLLPDGKKIYSEALFRIVAGKIEGENNPQILGFNFL